MRSRAYEAWREKEAYAVPVTEEGELLAVKRWHEFTAGWDAAIDEAVQLLKEKQEGVDSHNYFIVSAQIIKVLKNEC